MVAALLNKLLDGHSTSFARSDGESLVVSMNGHERAVSCDLWRSLPELEAAERDPAHHVASARTRPGSTNRAGHRVKIARGGVNWIIGLGLPLSDPRITNELSPND